jgi:hypothetical protein
METQRRMTFVLALLGCLFIVGAVLAAPTAATLDRYVIGGGGGHTEAGIYTLDGTIGQVVVGLDSASPLDLCSGFWCGAMTGHHVYLPLVVRHSP